MSGHTKWANLKRKRRGITHGQFDHEYWTGNRSGNNSKLKQGVILLVSEDTGIIMFIRREPEGDHPVRVYQMPRNWGS